MKLSRLNASLVGSLVVGACLMLAACETQSIKTEQIGSQPGKIIR